MDTLSTQTSNLGSPDVDITVAAGLQSVDWDFIQPRAGKIESIHPYPAKFIEDIPRALIERIPIPKSTLVFDPFCGSGTTLVECQRAGLHSVGIDLNPIACLLTRVKTSSLPAGFVDASELVIEESIGRSVISKRSIPNVGHWFSPSVQQAIESLLHTISMEKYSEWFDQLRVALSSILVKVSNQESDTRYAAVEKGTSYEDVFHAFRVASRKLHRSLSLRSWSLPDAHIIQGNTLEISSKQIPGKVGLVITSPPYPNAYEYWLYHKYRMWWLGFDPIAVKENEIGARAHFFKKNHHTSDVFSDQMSQTFTLIDSVLVRRGHVCIVVGRSKIHGELVDNSAIVDRVARSKNFIPVARFERVISKSRKSFNLSHANIKTETVLVFRKG